MSMTKKDKNGIEIKCENCEFARFEKTMPRTFIGCDMHHNENDAHCEIDFIALKESLEARISELQAQQFTRKEIHFIKCNLDLNNPNKDGAYDMWTAIRTKCDAIMSKKGNK